MPVYSRASGVPCLEIQRRRVSSVVCMLRRWRTTRPLLCGSEATDCTTVAGACFPLHHMCTAVCIGGAGDALRMTLVFLFHIPNNSLSVHMFYVERKISPPLTTTFLARSMYLHCFMYAYVHTPRRRGRTRTSNETLSEGFRPDGSKTAIFGTATLCAVRQPSFEY